LELLKKNFFEEGVYIKFQKKKEKEERKRKKEKNLANLPIFPIDHIGKYEFESSGSIIGGIENGVKFPCS